MRKSIFGAVAVAAGAAFGGEVFWNASVLDGYYNDGTSWTGGVAPSAGDTGRFGDNNSITTPADYLVRFPAGGLTESSCNWIRNLPSGSTVTFDATGTWWLKKKSAGESWENRDHVFRIDNENHIFNIESVSNSGGENDNFAFMLEDGAIRYEAATDGDRLVFASGTFNNYKYPLDDTGTVSQHTTILLTSGWQGLNSKVEFAGATAHIRAPIIRGNTPGGEVLVSGGDVHIYDGLQIKTDSNTDREGVFRVSGGKATVENSAIWLGRNNQGDARLALDGTGELEHKGNAVYFPDNGAQTGYFDIAGNGYYHSDSSGISAGHNGGTAHMTVRENGRLEMNNNVHIGEADNCYATLSLSDNAYFRVNTLESANGGSNRRVEISLADNATLALNYGTWFNGTGTDGTFTMDGGRLVFRTTNWIWILIGNNNSAVAKSYFNGGVVDDGSGHELGSLNFGGGPGSGHVFNGTEVHVRNFVVEGQQNVENWTNTVEIKGGAVRVRTENDGNGLDIRGNNRNAMLLVSGGELYVGNMIRIGHGGANNGYHAVFRQTGGTVWQSGVVNMCDAGGSDGEFELLGGVFYGKDIRGWGGSIYRGNTGWARCYFNGGTLKPYSDNCTLIYTMPEASLGPDGLTVDTEGKNAKVSALFQNDGLGTEDEAEGLFVKKGAGTLTVYLTERDGGAQGEYAGRSLASDHTYTKVLGGKVKFDETAEARFGRNVTVGHGGTLSLEGTPAKLTVETFTLGDGAGFSTLYLDAGDLVYVTGENGVSGTSGAIDGPFAGTDGTYDVFVCDYEPDVADLADISVLDADAAKSYTWTVRQIETGDDAGKYVASLTIADAPTPGTSQWSGTESSDWATAGNWTGSVPTAADNAVFPASAANKIVASAEGAAAHALQFQGGDYTLNGSAAVASGAGVSVAAGSVSVTAPLALGRVAAMDVAAGATLTAGPLRAGGSQLVKTGSGKLVLNGDNSGFAGQLVAGGGTLEVANRAALGPEELTFPFVLRSGTFHYAGPAVTDPAAFSIAADAEQKPVILRNDSDMTFSSVSYTRGVFVKTGAGALILDLPPGQFYLGSGAEAEHVETAGAVNLPASGDSPSTNGICGVTILEGELRVRGAGIDKTTVSTMNTALLGGGYAATAPAVLDIRNARVNWGAGSRHAFFCRDLPAGAPPPEVRLADAYLWSDSGELGVSAGSEVSPTVTMTNSTFFDHYNAQIGGGNVHPVIDANNSKFYNDGTYGVNLRGDFTADFYGPDALFGCVYLGGVDYHYGNTLYPRGGAVIAYNNIFGSLTIRDGAVFATGRGVIFRNQGVITTVFDGGTFEVRTLATPAPTMSLMWNPDDQGFTVRGKGLTLNMQADVDHEITFPIRGEGKVVKTGPGILRLVHCYDFLKGTVQEDRAVDFDAKLIQYAGDTQVAEGTLVVDGGVIGDTAAFTVDADATLDLNASAVTAASYAGAGTVANGTLAAGPILIDAAGADFLTLKDVTPAERQQVTFDFGGEPPVSKTTRVVARMTDADGEPLESYDPTLWKGVTADEGFKVYCKFAYDAGTGDVTVTFSNTSGTMIFLR